MRNHGWLLSFAVPMWLAAAACTPADDPAGGGETGANMETLADDLNALSGARILLGHQSVGRNIIAGLESLSVEAGVPLRMQQVTAAAPGPGTGIFHSNIGINGDPNSKCEMFAELLDAHGQPGYDLAMMKFCYEDLGRDTPLEVAAMLDRYDRLVTQIRERHPELQLVHITMPLRADPPGKKTFVKRMIGRATHTDADNVLRNAFNDALRERYGSEPMFDLAAVESTLPDGSRSSFRQNGQAIYTLAAAYTDDGAHLNENARRRAATAFVRALASALQLATPRSASVEAST